MATSSSLATRQRAPLLQRGTSLRLIGSRSLGPGKRSSINQGDRRPIRSRTLAQPLEIHFSQRAAGHRQSCKRCANAVGTTVDRGPVHDRGKWWSEINTLHDAQMLDNDNFFTPRPTLCGRAVRLNGHSDGGAAIEACFLAKASGLAGSVAASSRSTKIASPGQTGRPLLRSFVRDQETWI